MSGSDREAVEALERLGLSNYEARVFVALQKLGAGTAREVSEIADVPRSQVYGAAEELESRGLIEIQQSTPKRYRPVSLDAARRRLSERLERERDRAFDYLSEVHEQRAGRETRDDVWTVRGREPIADRTTDLVDRADSRVLYGAARPELVSDELVAALRERATAGVEVRVVSENPDVRTLFADEPVAVGAVASSPTESSGRMLLCDDDVALLSVLAASDLPDVTEETAIWSAGTPIAAVLVELTGGAVGALLDVAVPERERDDRADPDARGADGGDDGPAADAERARDGERGRDDEHGRDGE